MGIAWINVSFVGDSLFCFMEGNNASKEVCLFLRDIPLFSYCCIAYTRTDVAWCYDWHFFLFDSESHKID